MYSIERVVTVNWVCLPEGGCLVHQASLKFDILLLQAGQKHCIKILPNIVPFCSNFFNLKKEFQCVKLHYEATCKLKTVKLFFQLPASLFLSWLILTDKDGFPLRRIVLFVVVLSLPGGTAPLICRECKDAVYGQNRTLTSNWKIIVK